MIKKATKKDIPVLKKLFTETVLEVNRKDYSEEQTKDWASCGTELSKWENRLIQFNHYIYLKGTETVGFVAFNQQGFINSMFVSKDYQRSGIAQSLMNFTLQECKKNQVIKLTSEVSITAKPFFEKNGFVVIQKQNAKANQLTLVNYLMQLNLNS
jgi:putative acetyltransferase